MNNIEKRLEEFVKEFFQEWCVKEKIVEKTDNMILWGKPFIVNKKTGEVSNEYPNPDK